MNNEKQFELQLFDGKRYATVATGERRKLEPLFYGLKCARRIVDPDKQRDLVPRYRPPRGSTGSALTADQAVRAYFDWAIAKGLTSVAVYANGRAYPQLATLKLRYVPVADFLGPAPEPETEE